jgi:hypothetical protein
MRREEAIAGGFILGMYLGATSARDDEKSEMHTGQFTAAFKCGITV